MTDDTSVGNQPPGAPIEDDIDVTITVVANRRTYVFRSDAFVEQVLRSLPVYDENEVEFASCSDNDNIPAMRVPTTEADVPVFDVDQWVRDFHFGEIKTGKKANKGPQVLSTGPLCIIPSAKRIKKSSSSCPGSDRVASSGEDVVASKRKSTIAVPVQPSFRDAPPPPPLCTPSSSSSQKASRPGRPVDLPFGASSALPVRSARQPTEEDEIMQNPQSETAATPTPALETSTATTIPSTLPSPTALRVPFRYKAPLKANQAKKNLPKSNLEPPMSANQRALAEYKRTIDRLHAEANGAALADNCFMSAEDTQLWYELSKYIATGAPIRWTDVAAALKRSDRYCRDRWNDVLNPAMTYRRNRCAEPAPRPTRPTKVVDVQQQAQRVQQPLSLQERHQQDVPVAQPSSPQPHRTDPVQEPPIPQAPQTSTTQQPPPVEPVVLQMQASSLAVQKMQDLQVQQEAASSSVQSAGIPKQSIALPHIDTTTTTTTSTGTRAPSQAPTATVAVAPVAVSPSAAQAAANEKRRAAIDRNLLQFVEGNSQLLREVAARVTALQVEDRSYRNAFYPMEDAIVVLWMAACNKHDSALHVECLEALDQYFRRPAGSSAKRWDIFAPMYPRLRWGQEAYGVAPPAYGASSSISSSSSSSSSSASAYGGNVPNFTSGGVRTTPLYFGPGPLTLTAGPQPTLPQQALPQWCFSRLNTSAGSYPGGPQYGTSSLAGQPHCSVAPCPPSAPVSFAPVSFVGYPSSISQPQSQQQPLPPPYASLLPPPMSQLQPQPQVQQQQRPPLLHKQYPVPLLPPPQPQPSSGPSVPPPAPALRQQSHQQKPQLQPPQLHQSPGWNSTARQQLYQTLLAARSPNASSAALAAPPSSHPPPLPVAPSLGNTTTNTSSTSSRATSPSTATSNSLSQRRQEVYKQFGRITPSTLPPWLIGKDSSVGTSAVPATDKEAGNSQGSKQPQQSQQLPRYEYSPSVPRQQEQEVPMQEPSFVQVPTSDPAPPIDSYFLNNAPLLLSAQGCRDSHKVAAPIFQLLAEFSPPDVMEVSSGSDGEAVV